MPKNKRLENALNAGKLIQLGFSLNDAKPQKLNLLYSVNCLNNFVNFGKINNNDVAKTNDPEDSDFESDNSLSGSDDYEKSEILSLQFNQTQNLLATGDSNGRVQIYDVFSACPISNEDDSNIKKSKLDLYYEKCDKISSISVYNMPIITMKWHPYSNYSCNFLYYAHVNGYIGVCEKETLKKSILIQEKDEISCIDFNLDGSVLSSVGKDYTIKLYDSNLNGSENMNRIVKEYGTGIDSSSDKNSFFSSISNAFSSILSSNNQSTSHTNRIQCVKFSNTSNDLFFTGGWDRSVKAWDKRSKKGFVNSFQGPFICGSDAIDVNDHLVLTASWVKENALELWDIRKFKKICSLPIVQENKNEDDSNIDKNSLSYKLRLKDPIVNEYLYACKFFPTTNRGFSDSKKINENKEVSRSSTSVLACGSGTQSLHLLDYEQPTGRQLLSSINCQSPLYCMDAIYSLAACGGVKNFFTVIGTSD
ncbi:unnamed protein product [Brachionus calyciflorus]|uniref:Uncharacterized protein n=1 Tax=Brachionus calyciflorus TaxID=104777 RepID=A0A813V1Z7_9BILA|nr:unnamed protein product [Brachionus calyciflorus]